MLLVFFSWVSFLFLVYANIPFKCLYTGLKRKPFWFLCRITSFQNQNTYECNFNLIINSRLWFCKILAEQVLLFCFSWSRYYSSYEGLLLKVVFYKVCLLDHPLMNQTFSCCALFIFLFTSFWDLMFCFGIIDLQIEFNKSRGNLLQWSFLLLYTVIDQICVFRIDALIW